MFILKVVKVLCFDTLLQVLILKVVRGANFEPFACVDSKQLNPEGSANGQERRCLQVGEARGSDQRFRHRKMEKRQRSCRSRRKSALLPDKYSSTRYITGQEVFCAVGRPPSRLYKLCTSVGQATLRVKLR